MSQDYYQILGVAKTAGTPEIRKAYLTLARTNHPDRFTDPEKRREADELFQQINAAFNTLRDEVARKDYDRSLQKEQRTPEEEAKLYFKNAEFREKSRDWDNALKLYYEAMRIQPEKIEYKMGAARVLARDKAQQRKAAQLLDEVIRVQPDAREGYLILGDLYTRSGLHVRAKRVYENALKRMAGDSEFRSLLSEANAAMAKARG